jgi:hypothetical protein
MRRWYDAIHPAAIASLAFALVSSVGGPARAWQTPIDQDKLVGQLMSQRWTERRAGVTAILDVPVAQRSSVLIRGVVRELSRLQGQPDTGYSEVPAGLDTEAGWEYYSDLVSIISESDDPIVIAPLVRAVGMGNPAVSSLARFGEAAVPELLAEVNRRNAPNYALMALRGFREILEQHFAKLSKASLSGIAALARRHLTGRQISAVVGRAIDVAGLLRDESLRSDLLRIERSSTPDQAGLALLDTQADFAALRVRARLALDKQR